MILASAETTFYDTPDFFIYPNPTTASCFDGIMNQNELGIDCGGVCQAICNNGGTIGGPSGPGGNTNFNNTNISNVNNITVLNKTTVTDVINKLTDTNQPYGLIFIIIIGLIILFLLILFVYFKRKRE